MLNRRIRIGAGFTHTPKERLLALHVMASRLVRDGTEEDLPCHRRAVVEGDQGAYFLDVVEPGRSASCNHRQKAEVVGM